MKTNKSKSIIALISVVVLLSFVIGYWFDHPTNWDYSDRFVKGSSVDQIIAKYGEFDIVFYTDTNNNTISTAGYLVQEKKKGFFGTSPEKYYMIIFDVNGIAIRVSIEDGNWGG